MRVVIESPYAARDGRTVEDNVAYALACVSDCLSRGESPIAGHLVLPRVLDDTDPTQRAAGIAAAFEWYRVADLVAVYVDHGTSAGMTQGIAEARRLWIRIQYRRIGD